MHASQRRYEPIKISRDFLSSVACAISDLRDDVRGAIDLQASLAVAMQCPSLTVQPLRQVSVRYTCLCSASEFSREDSPGAPLRKTAFFVYVQSDAKNDTLTQQKEWCT